MHAAPASNPSAWNRLQRTSRWMVMACWAMQLALPIALLLYWGWAGDEQLANAARLPAGALAGELQAWQRVAAGVVSAVPLALLLMGLTEARRCFEQFARGQVFTRSASLSLQHFARWVAWASLAHLLAHAAVSVLLTLHQPAGQRHLVVSVGTNEVMLLFFAGLVWLMSAVIGQGERLAEENEGFV